MTRNNFVREALSRPRLARPISEAPCITETPEAVVEYYDTSAAFVKTDRYPGDVAIADGELGYLGIFEGNMIYPVARICVKQ